MYEYGSTFYERIENILRMHKISKIQFYSDLKLSKTTVLNWKKKNLHSLSVMLQISNYLDVSIDWLYNGIDHQDSSKSESPAQIVNRIKLRLEELTEISKYDTDSDRFYYPLHDCIKPYELIKWSYGIQTQTIEKLIHISNNLHISLQELITGSKVAPENYDVYFNSGDSELDSFHKTYNCLTDENRKTVNKVCYGLFIGQDYNIKLNNLNKQKELFMEQEDPYKE